MGNTCVEITMVGVVIVSHSKALADAVCELVKQAAKMASVVGVGGVGENAEDFGTDAIAIMEAIMSVYSNDGVLVLMDMGSALLSTQTALELLEKDIAHRIEMCSAPLVEGAIVAAVQSSIGANITTVKTEALNSLHPKQERMDDGTSCDIATTSSLEEDVRVEIPKDAKKVTLIIRNQHGLHARPAAAFVLATSKHDVHVYVGLKDDSKKLVSARSLNAIAKLNVQQGDAIIVYAWGKDAQALLEELKTLALHEFEEKQIYANEIETNKHNTIILDTAMETKETEHTSQTLRSISRGLAIGVTWKMNSTTKPEFLITQADSPDTELAILDTLLAKTEKTLDEDIAVQTENTIRNILKMHKVMLLDPDLYQKAGKNITQKHHTAVYAWYLTCKQSANEYRALKENDYLQARADDIMDIGIRLMRESDTVTLPSISNAPDNAILFINEITPDIITKINVNTVRGIVTKEGGSTSHAAIIARAQNIPMVSGFQDMESIQTHTPVIVDASTSQVIVNPSDRLVLYYEEKRKKISALRKNIYADAQSLAYTREKIQVACEVNIGSRKEIDMLVDYGAEGVGLFRSEFLFLNRGTPPSEEEQYEVYTYLAKSLSHKSVVVRILDIGGDKQIPYLPLPRENNPFLGVRGVRFDLKYTQFLMPQLRALFRASVHGTIKIMVPMVVDVQEIRAIKEKMELAKQELKMEHTEHAHDIPLGIMIETPASVISVRELAMESDFFSIGTNDLIQYILAVERDSMSLSSMYDVCHPSVLRAIQQVVDSARDADISLSVCGESASDVEVIPIFLGMGIRHVSMSASSIPAIKYLIRTLCCQDCEAMMHHIWALGSACDIREYVRKKFPVIELLLTMT